MAKEIAMESTDALVDQDQPQEGTVAGMVWIRRANQQQWIWPVHLPGWLELGWRVAHPSAAPVGLEVTEQPVAPEPEQAADAQAATPACARRRGRKAKAVDATDSADTTTMTPTTPEELQDPGVSEPLAVAEQEPTQPVAPTEPTTDASATPNPTGTDSGFALPEDLLSGEF